MDIYIEATKYLLNNPLLSGWAEIEKIIEKVAAGKPSHWRLPVVVCLTVGGTQEQALPAMAAIAAFHTSIIMVDDLLDGDRRFESLGFNVGDVANMAVALQAAAMNAISHSQCGLENKHLILERLSEMMLSATLGQHMDTHSQTFDEPTYWNIIKTGGSPFFASALYSGALIGGAPRQTADILSNVGCIYGELIQIHDDIKDALEKPAASDWNDGQFSLPILFAAGVNHPQRDRFLELRRRINEPQALNEAQSILFSSGAISYCAHQAVQRFKKTQEILQTITVPDRTPLDTVLNKIIAPVYRLLDTGTGDEIKSSY